MNKRRTIDNVKSGVIIQALSMGRILVLQTDASLFTQDLAGVLICDESLHLCALQRGGRIGRDGQFAH